MIERRDCEHITKVFVFIPKGNKAVKIAHLLIIIDGFKTKKICTGKMSLSKFAVLRSYYLLFISPIDIQPFRLKHIRNILTICDCYKYLALESGLLLHFAKHFYSCGVHCKTEVSR